MYVFVWCVCVCVSTEKFVFFSLPFFIDDDEVVVEIVSAKMSVEAVVVGAKVSSTRESFEKAPGCKLYIVRLNYVI